MRSQPAPSEGRESSDPFPDRLYTTIRVERVEDGRFRATQRDSDFEGLGATPHRAIADYAETVERACIDLESLSDSGSSINRR